MMLRAAQLCACFVLACGCKSEDHRVIVLGRSASQSPVLDALLVGTNAAARIKAAAQDLPSDEWRTTLQTGRYNVTRSRRAGDLAQQLLAGLPRSLTNMPAQELVASLKTFSYGDYGSFEDTAYYVYLIGNRMILDELGRRTRDELHALWTLRGDTREIFTGLQGPLRTIGDLVTYDLLPGGTNGQPDGAANRSQPVRSGTNQPSATAGSGR